MKLIKKYLKKQIKNLFNSLMEEDTKNIERELQRLALRKTAIFVIESGLLTIPVFKDKFELLKFAISKILIDGLVLEFGVYKGETINFIAKLLKDKVVYGFDSFEGLPETWRFGFEKGTFYINGLPKVENNVKLIKGWFEDSLPTFMKEFDNKTIAFLHIDCDLYSSTKAIFENLRNNIVPGTIIVFDEYFNYPGWENGENKAFMEFIEESKLQFEYIGFVKFHEQVAVRIK